MNEDVEEKWKERRGGGVRSGQREMGGRWESWGCKKNKQRINRSKEREEKNRPRGGERHGEAGGKLSVSWRRETVTGRGRKQMGRNKERGWHQEEEGDSLKKKRKDGRRRGNRDMGQRAEVGF